MNTLAGAVTFVGSLLLRLMVRPPAGAAADRVTDRLAVWPRLTDVLATVIMGRLATFTVAIAVAMPGALAVMVAVAADSAVTVTTALVAPAANDTVEATVALAVSLELRLTVKPPVGA